MKIGSRKYSPKFFVKGLYEFIFCNYFIDYLMEDKLYLLKESESIGLVVL